MENIGKANFAENGTFITKPSHGCTDGFEYISHTYIFARAGRENCDTRKLLMALRSVLCAAPHQAGERDTSGIRFTAGPLRGLLPGCFKSSLGCQMDKMSCYLFVKPTQEGRIEIPPIMNSKRTLKICRQQGRISGIYPYPSSLPTVVSSVSGGGGSPSCHRDGGKAKL